MRTRIFKQLAVLAVVLSPMTANAVILDFEVGAAGTCYSDTCTNVQGFDFSFVAGGWAVNDDGNAFFNRNGRAADEGLVGGHMAGNGAPPLTITMTRSGGGTFDLGSLDAATGLGTFAGTTSIDLIGTLFGGGTVSQTLSATSTWDNYTLSGFTNLTQLVFSNMDAVAGISIDNLDDTVAVAVPEPSTIALIFLGLAGLGFVRRAKV